MMLWFLLLGLAAAQEHLSMVQNLDMHGRKKLGVALGGGGFRAFTGAVALHRSFTLEGFLEHVTHFSSVSGATWFLTGVAFGSKTVGDTVKTHAEAIANPEADVGEIISDMGDAYVAGIMEALRAGELSWMPTMPNTYVPGTTCGLAGRAELNACVRLLEAWVGEVPALDWLLLNEAFLKAFGLPKDLHLRQAERYGLKDATLIFATSLAPDMWVREGCGNQTTCLARIEGKEPGATDVVGRGEPVSYVAPSVHNAGHEKATVHGPRHRFIAIAGRPDLPRVPLSLPRNPPLTWIAAASSAAVGFFDSPTQGKELRAALHISDGCAAAGLQEVAVPFRISHRVAASHNAYLATIIDDDAYQTFESATGHPNPFDAARTGGWYAPSAPPAKEEEEHETDGMYRLIDGNMLDGTGAAEAVAKMQEACDADCIAHDVLDLIVVTWFGRTQWPIQHLFADRGDQESDLQYDRKIEGGSAIFQGPPPTDDQFVQFTSVASEPAPPPSMPPPPTPPPHLPVESPAPPPGWLSDFWHRPPSAPPPPPPPAAPPPRMLLSHKWEGHLLTAENRRFGVVGGQKIRVLILNLGMHGVTGGGDTLAHTTNDALMEALTLMTDEETGIYTEILPAEMPGLSQASHIFRDIYAADARAAVDALRPHLRSFLSHLRK